MQKQPLYLRFKDQEEAELALSTCAHPVEIDIIGHIYNDNGVYSDEGECITSPTMKDGWHVNLLAPLDCTDYDAYTTPVKSPARIWAGF